MKYIFGALVIPVFIGLCAAGIHICRVNLRNKKEMAAFEADGQTTVKPYPKTLVVYYSLTGRTADIARKIADRTGADVAVIETKEPLPKGAALHIAVKKSLKGKQYPEIAGNLPSPAGYDIIFVGAPVWWYTIATPALSYLTQTDFAGKKVVPFSTQGSNAGAFFEDFAANEKNAVVLKGAQFNNLPAEYDQAVGNKVSAWLNELPTD